MRREHIEQEFGKQNIPFAFFDAVTPDRIDEVAKNLILLWIDPLKQNYLMEK